MKLEKGNNIYKFKLFISVLAFFALFGAVNAQEYIPLAPVPGVSESGVSLGGYLTAAFNIGIGLASVLSVLMIVVAGVQFIGGSASPSARKDAKERIQNAIFGLLIALSSWLIVYAINPQIINGVLGITPVSTVLPVDTVPYSDDAAYVEAGPIPTPSPSSVLSEPAIAPGSPSTYIPPTTDSSPVDFTSFYTSAPESFSDPSNDMSILMDCVGKDVDGICSIADINSDGKVTGDDLSGLLDAFKYDVNGDGVVEFGSADEITYCFFKENTEPVLPPNEDCEFDVFSSCIYTDAVQKFNFDCATNRSSAITLDRSDFLDFQRVVRSSQDGSGRINLRSLYSNVYYCDDLAYLPFACVFSGDRALQNIIYTTFIQYDTNDDGVADFNGGDPLSDFNGDGVIDDKDSRFIDFIKEDILGSGDFTPIGFTLGAMEAWMFDGRGFTDAQVVEYCIGKPPIMGCAMSDIDRSCFADPDRYDPRCTVTITDLNILNSGAALYDVNDDGVVNLSQ